MIKDENFGSFLTRKRQEKEISLRAFAKLIDISVTYLSKIENGMKQPPLEAVLKRIAAKLVLTKEEMEYMYDLAARGSHTPTVPHDIRNYINDNPILSTLLRTARDCDVPDEKLKEFIEKLELLKKEREVNCGDGEDV